ncbi:MAG: response regulator [Scytolyngbya sp. HA4215-MV1]|nr:response regulator [Scytolyngbya sp. HA4215-MV1]
MTSQSPGYANIIRTLAVVSTQKLTGELTFTDGKKQWKLYFFHGRLVYGTGNFHRIRRYYRVVKYHCPHFHFEPLLAEEPWEYRLLSQATSCGQLSVNQAKAITQSSLMEVLFSIVSNSALTPKWSMKRRVSLSDSTALNLLLSSSQIEHVIQQAQLLWNVWQSLGLGTVSPYMVPILSEHLGSGFVSLPNTMLPFLKGQHTLWDIAAQVKKPITTVIRFLLPWVQKGVLSFRDIPDLMPFSAQQPQTLPGQQPKPLIACIDDSPLVGKILAQILEPAGYRLLSIHNPLLGIAELVKHRPSLLFLDLVMPDTSGYNLCSFLRRTLLFEQTPIIILTGQDGLLDRTRAKLVGASDFLGKPAEPQQVLHLVQHYLQKEITVSPKRPKPQFVDPPPPQIEGSLAVN